MIIFRYRLDQLYDVDRAAPFKPRSIGYIKTNLIPLFLAEVFNNFSVIDWDRLLKHYKMIIFLQWPIKNQSSNYQLYITSLLTSIQPYWSMCERNQAPREADFSNAMIWREVCLLQAFAYWQLCCAKTNDCNCYCIYSNHEKRNAPNVDDTV